MAARIRVHLRCLLLAMFLIASQSENYDVLLEDSVPGVSIGNASDMFVDVQCRRGDGGTRWEWHVFNVHTLTLPNNLSPLRTSYNESSGLLRVFASFIREHAQDGVLNMQCLEYTGTGARLSAVLPLSLEDTLFFNQPLPATIPLQENLTSLCSSLLSTLPASTVSVQTVDVPGGTSYMYCVVTTERGTFRSRSVVVGSGNSAFLQFNVPFIPEIIRITGETEPTQLICEVIGDPLTTTISFLKNGEPIPSDGFSVSDSTPDCSEDACVRRVLTILGSPARGQEGVYQCMAQVGQDGSTAIVSTSYVNIQFLSIPIITDSIPGENNIILQQPDTPSEVVLNCTVEAHPIPSLTWTRDDGNPVDQQQGITRFRQTAFSVLTVPVAELEGRVEFTCTADGVRLSKHTSVVINSYIQVTITEQPVSPPMPILTGETVTFSCAASSIPIPDITWFQDQDRQLSSDSDDVTIVSEELSETTRRSTLQLRLSNEIDFTDYFCRGNNNFVRADSISVRIEHAFVNSPSITTSTPEENPSPPGGPEPLSEVVFNCSVEANPTPSITWTRDDGIAVDQQQIMEVGEMSFSSLLTVSLAQLEGRVEFTCTAEVMGTTAQSSYNITRFSLVTITDHPQSLPPLMIGETAILSCTASSIPIPEITWFQVQNGMVLELNTEDDDVNIVSVMQNATTLMSTLELSLNNATDFTEYFCRGDNSFVRTDSNTVQIEQAFLSPPTITDSIPGENIIILQQPATPSEVVLNCTVEAHPIPFLTWTRDDGNPVDQLENFTEVREMTFSSLLTVPSALLEGRVEFTCTVEVMDMTAEVPVVITAYSPVIITEQPVSPPPLLIGKTATLSCTASSIPIPEITWFQIQNGMDVELSADDNSVTIISAMPNTTTRMSTLQLHLSNEMSFTEYFCHGDNNFNSTDSNTVQIDQAFLNITIIIDSVPRDTIILQQPDTPSAVALNCTVEAAAGPTPSFVWARVDGLPIGQQPTITRVGNTTTSSLLTVPVAQLEGRVEFTCTAEAAGTTEQGSINTTTYSPVIITEQPVSPSPLPIGETAILSCTASSIPIPEITWFQTQNGTDIQLSDGVTTVPQNETTLMSTLQLPLNNEMDFTQYFCRGDNSFVTRSSSTVQIEQASIPTITMHPQNMVATNGEEISFICQASGSPTPDINWRLVPSTTNISTTPTTTQNGAKSELIITGTIALNGTVVNCVAGNSVGNITSDNAILIVTANPIRPVLTVVSVTAHSVVVQCTQPFSLISVMEYSIIIHRRGFPSDNGTASVDCAGSSTNFTNLRPFSLYYVEVSAVNGDGSSTGSVNFTTLEAAPEAAPTNVVAEALDTHRIRLTWEPPPVDKQNGVIVNYIIHYYLLSNPQSTVTGNTSNSSLEFILEELEAGAEYSISVAAVTVSPGPLSNEVTQQTIMQPPPFPSKRLTTFSRIDITGNTIPIVLPPVDETQFSHFWVIVVRLDDSPTYLLENPKQQFPDNSSFTRYSATVPVNVPYIVAEMSASTYSQNRRFFFLGDEVDTAPLNDFPNLYRNGPLMEGARYTAFVWGFAHSVPPQSSEDGEGTAKRQDSLPRQYSVFTSSEFLNGTSTTQQESEVDIVRYVVAGAGSLGALLLGGIVIILVWRCTRWRRRTPKRVDISDSTVVPNQATRQWQSPTGTDMVVGEEYDTATDQFDMTTSTAYRTWSLQSLNTPEATSSRVEEQWL